MTVQRTTNQGRSHWREAVSRDERGVVMLVVVGTMAIIVIVALSLMAIGRKELQASGDFVRHVRSELLASAAVERAIAILRADRNGYDTLLEPWHTDPSLLRSSHETYGASEVAPGRVNGVTHSGIEDEESKVNLNRAPAAMLAALPGLTTEVAKAIVVGRGGRQFATPDELLRLKGVTPALYAGDAKAGKAGLRSLVTVWGSGKINVNTAPREVLAAIPGLGAAQVSSLIGRRQRLPGPNGGPFRDTASVFAFLQLPPLVAQQAAKYVAVSSTVFRFVAAGRATGRRDGDAGVRIAAVIDRAAQPLRILYWRQLSRRLQHSTISKAGGR